MEACGDGGDPCGAGATSINAHPPQIPLHGYVHMSTLRGSRRIWRWRAIRDRSFLMEGAAMYLSSQSTSLPSVRA